MAASVRSYLVPGTGYLVPNYIDVVFVMRVPYDREPMTVDTIPDDLAPASPVAGTVDAPLRLETLSPSRASDFKLCPQLFKFKAIDKLDAPPTVHQARGTTAHLALQRLFDDPAPERTPARLYDLFRDAWSELKPVEYPDLFEDIESERAWGIESLEVLANYFAIEDPAQFDPLDRELDMLEDIGRLTIRGILDRMEEGPDGLVITDYKTGKAPPQRYALPAFFALKIYALLIRNRTGRTPSALKLMYLNGPTVYEIPVTDGQLDAMERQLIALWTAIERAMETGSFPARPGRLCGWCSFQDRCPAFAEEASSGDEG
jgi:putative RecB family exonuclease